MHGHTAVLGECMDGDAETSVGEDGREDPVRELAQLRRRLCEQRVREVEPPDRLEVDARLELRADEAERQPERDQPLLGTVVKVALEPSALGVPGGHDARLGGTQLLEAPTGLCPQALVLERETSRRRHLVDELLVVEDPRRMREHGDGRVIADECRLLLARADVDRAAVGVDEAV